MIAIIDYGVGNLFSLQSSLERVGAETVVTSDKAVIEAADKIILPGVGAFEDAAKKLKATGLDEVVKAQAKKASRLWAYVWVCKCSLSGVMNPAVTKVWGF